MPDAPESDYAWIRLFAALLLAGIGGVGMWSVIVALPAVQAEFGVARSAASLPYTMTMISFGFGSILMGRLSDRFGIFVPVVGGAIGLALGYAVASQATSLWQFSLAQGLLVGVASSVAFAPLIADTSLWFTRHRGMAVAIIASGSYVAGTIWPPVVQHFIETEGWRRTYLGIAVFCVATMLPLALALRRRSPLTETTSATTRVASRSLRPLGMSPAGLQTTEDALSMSLAERRRRRVAQPGFWTRQAANTLDRATAMMPRLLYQRLDEFGCDYAIVYPTAGLRMPRISDDATRVR